MGLDSRGRDLNTVSPESPEYSIGGLPANTQFGLAVWNATRRRQELDRGTVTTNAAGVARFQVPLQAAFALTNVPVVLRGSGGARTTAPRRQDWLSSPLTPQVSESR